MNRSFFSNLSFDDVRPFAGLLSGSHLGMSAFDRLRQWVNDRLDVLQRFQTLLADDDAPQARVSAKEGIQSDAEGIASSGGTDAALPNDGVEDLLLADAFRLNADAPLDTAATVTFAFLDAVPDYYRPYNWAHDDFQPFTAQQQEVTRDALAMIASYSNLVFVETDPDAAAITFGLADLPRDWAGYAYYPTDEAIGRKAADVWIDGAWAGETLTPGSEPYKTLIHEIGHAIGLGHPGSGLTGEEDSRKYTVMSANSHPDAAGEPNTHMLYDIAAVQRLYGANTNHAVGDNVYDFTALGNRIQTLWDGGGSDILDLSQSPFPVHLDLGQGAFSTTTDNGRDNLAIAYGTTIENAIGGADDDTLIGNATGNWLAGGFGNDILTGGGGANVFAFGPGWGHDTISDFRSGADRLDLTGTGLSFANLSISASESATTIGYDTNLITLPGVAAVAENDFLLAETPLLA